MDLEKNILNTSPVLEASGAIRKLVDELSQEFKVVSQIKEIGSQKHLITSIDARKTKFLVVELIGVNDGISYQDMGQLKESIIKESIIGIDPVVAFHMLNKKPTDDEARSFFHRGFDDWMTASTSTRMLRSLIDVLSYQGFYLDYKKINALESQTSKSCVTDLFDALLKDCLDAKAKVFQVGPEGTECALQSVNCDLHACSQIIGSAYLFQLCEFVNMRIQQGPPWSNFFQEIVYQALEKLTNELVQLQSKRPHFLYC